VSAEIPGCIARERTCYANGAEAQILDVFEAELGVPCGTSAHPEDVLVTTKRWRLLRRFDSPGDADTLANWLNRQPMLFKGFSDRVYPRKSGPVVEKSLELIHPEDLWWWIREDKGKRRNRALFRTGFGAKRLRYDLAVTDPQWLAQLSHLPPGIYPQAGFLQKKDQATYLTISLSEPFERFHYKLVAGVALLPATK
ncbi:MAG: hypothetical protein WCA37_01650, partial [Terracidiphilus sp.]